MTYEQELRDRIEYLEAENSELRELIDGEKVGQITGIMQAEFRLTPTESNLLWQLTGERAKSRRVLFNTLYRDRIDQPDFKIIDIFICRMRQKLAPFGIKIETVPRFGFCLSEESQLVLTALLGLEVDANDD